MGYTSPGVTIIESVSPSIAPTLASPQIVALVGDAEGKQTATESVTLTGITASALRHTGVDEASAVLVDYTGKVIGTGSYTVVQTSDPNGGIVGDEISSVTRVASPGAAPTLAASGSGLTGTYQYVVTFINAGGETGPGPESSTIVLVNQGVALSGISIGAAGTTSRNIYRKKTAGTNADGVYHLVGTIANNSATTLNDTVDDITAQAGVAPPAGIGDGDTIQITYDYTDVSYYQPTLMSNYGDISAKYGSPYDADGNINSNLSFAARLMFVNGASEVLCVASKSPNQSDLQDALEFLESDPTVRIVYVADGSAGSIAALSAHVTTMNNIGYYRTGVAGRDGSVTNITPQSLRDSAKAINYEAVRLVSPTNFTMQNPVSGKDMNVGGQWVAAAIAGMTAARDVQIPLTRKSVAGFTGVNDLRTGSEQVLDSSAGLLAINLLGGVLFVRHDITTAVGSVNTRESSVVRAKYEMATRIKSALDAGVIGLVAPTQRALLVVRSVIIGVLEQLILEQAINGYEGVSARIADADPTTVEAQFQYDPAYPINNIVVTFSINTTTGTFVLQ